MGVLKHVLLVSVLKHVLKHDNLVIWYRNKDKLEATSLHVDKL